MYLLDVKALAENVSALEPVIVDRKACQLKGSDVPINASLADLKISSQ
jgi:hypothetical protein